MINAYTVQVIAIEKYRGEENDPLVQHYRVRARSERQAIETSSFVPRHSSGRTNADSAPPRLRALFRYKTCHVSCYLNREGGKMRGVVSGIFKNFGWLAIVISIVWWGAFVARISRTTGVGSDVVMQNFTACILYMSAPCSIASAAFELGGGVGYRPFLLWIGVGMIVLGYLLQLTGSKSKTS